jgi:hypothetical protein
MIFLHGMVILYAFVPPFLTIAAVFFHADPLYFVFQRSGSLGYVVTTFIRFPVVFITLFEMFRIVTTLLIFAITYTEMMFNCYAYLRKLSFSLDGVLRFEMTHRRYTQLAISFRICVHFQSYLSFLGVAVLMNSFICLTFGTLKLYNVVPLPLYLIFPTLLATVILFASQAMPRAMYIYEQSKSLIQDWKRLSPYKRRMNVRLIKSTSPIYACLAMPGGSLVPINRELTVAFYKKCVEYSVSALLAIPRVTLTGY